MKQIRKNFIQKYFLAKQFYKENGHLRIPRDYTVEANGQTIFLGEWIYHLRNMKTNPKKWFYVTPTEEKFLNKIQMEWDIYDTSFHDNLTYLIDHSVGLSIHAILMNEKLKVWMHNIRYDQLSGERKELYEKYQHLFSLSNLKWEYYYTLATLFYEKNGHLNISNDLVINGYPLGHWIQSQRQQKENNYLSNNQIEKLNNIGMIWKKNEYNFLHNKIDNTNKKRYYEKLKKRLYEYMATYEEFTFETIEQVKVFQYHFNRYLDERNK